MVVVQNWVFLIEKGVSESFDSQTFVREYKTLRKDIRVSKGA